MPVAFSLPLFMLKALLLPPAGLTMETKPAPRSTFGALLEVPNSMAPPAGPAPRVSWTLPAETKLLVPLASRMVQSPPAAPNENCNCPPPLAPALVAQEFLSDPTFRSVTV